jgi:hypothetical protein
MARETYKDIRFNTSTRALIAVMNEIVEDYTEQGFRLTVRQLYYQLVARDIVPNTERSYQRVTSIVNDARVGGAMDWDAIEDRTRAFLRRQRWESGAQILKASSASYHIDMWSTQLQRVFVIIEKEALVGVLEPVCQALDVPILAARGYPPATVLREFALSDIVPNGMGEGDQGIVVLHLGDHDPSGIDMTRDLRDRLEMFAAQPIDLIRIALTMRQIKQRTPPPNPAKMTDSRFATYCAEYDTDNSWELDALPPAFLAELVEGQIRRRIDEVEWEERVKETEEVRERIRELAKGFK